MKSEQSPKKPIEYCFKQNMQFSSQCLNANNYIKQASMFLNNYWWLVDELIEVNLLQVDNINVVPDCPFFSVPKT